MDAALCLYLNPGYPEQKARSTLPKMLDGGDYSDLTLRCGSQDFKVHRAVVCSRSPVIKAACDGPFEEATTRILNVNIADAATIETMLTFMYKGEIPQRWKKLNGLTEAGSERLGGIPKPDSDWKGDQSSYPEDFAKHLVSQIKCVSAAHYYRVGDFEAVAYNAARREISRAAEVKRDHKWRVLSPPGFSAIMEHIHLIPNIDLTGALRLCFQRFVVEHCYDLLKEDAFIDRAQEHIDFILDGIKRLVHERNEGLKAYYDMRKLLHPFKTLRCTACHTESYGHVYFELTTLEVDGVEMDRIRCKRCHKLTEPSLLKSKQDLHPL